MHYVGMAAVRAPATLAYRPGLVIASLAIAIFASWAALRAALAERSLGARAAGATLLGVAICAMHYTAMRAATFRPTAAAHVGAGDIGNLSLVFGVGTSTLLLLFMALLAAMFDRRFEVAALREAQAVAQREEQLRTILAQLPVGVIVASTSSGAVEYANPAAERLMGGDIVAGGAAIADALVALHPDGRPYASSEHPLRRALTAGERIERELVRYRRPDGGEFIAEISAAPIDSAPDGRTVLAISDVTARVEAQEALQQGSKLQSLGQLTGGVAHDFNNLLTPVIGALDIVSRRSSGDERQARLIAGAMQSAERARTLVQRLLAFARRQHLEARSVDVAALIAGMEDLIARSIGPQIKVLFRSRPPLPAAKVDPNQLELALLNLAVNARDAMPGGGTLAIVAQAEQVGPGHAAGIEAGDYVRITVSDTGTGMDPETLRRAVDPFFTTKGVGQGTGLGLSMVHGLAAQSGGGLQLSSTPGAGTRADLWLPVARDVASADPTVHDDPAPGRALRVLLVDDEPLVRAATAEMIIEAGHQVVQAETGRGALERLRSQNFDVLVTDYAMPGMTGTQLAAEAHRIDPRLPVLLITGYADLADEAAGGLPRLAKPFKQSALAKCLRSLTEAGGNVIRLVPRA
jgi:PAS domain S-box-containing protein